MTSAKQLANNNYGYGSAIFGVLGIIIIAISENLQSILNPRSAVFLKFLDSLGWVYKGPKALVAEVKPSPLLPFTDGSILSMLVLFGGYLSALAILYGLWAEYRNEDSLLLSAGLICGIFGFCIIHSATGFGVMLLCSGLVTWLRSIRKIS
jgi:hypothetical protein